MSRVKKAEIITDSEEHITMQDFSSTVSFSPSFSFYASGDGEIVEAAVRVVRESHSYYSVNVDDEFEFETLPLPEESFFHFPTTKLKTTTFKPSPEEEEEAYRVTSKNLFYGGYITDQSPSSPSQSHSSSESEDSEDLSPSRYYCFWSPMRSSARGHSSKSKSSSAPRRCRIKDLLRRSHSDGAVSTSSEPKRCRFKDLLRRSHSDGGGSKSPISPSGNDSPAVKGKNKTATNKYTNTGEMNIRRKTYLPYRQDLIGVFAGMSRLRR